MRIHEPAPHTPPPPCQALAHDFGARGAQVEEIVTMDDSEFANLAPVYGLIFLFKWTQEMAQAHKTSSKCACHISQNPSYVVL
jgi:hypothetical protein